MKMDKLPVRNCSIRCIPHREWGTFGVYEDRGDYYEIHGEGGTRILTKIEAVREWEKCCIEKENKDEIRKMQVLRDTLRGALL